MSKAEVPPGLETYTIRVQPNWVARVSIASVLLLLLFFSIVQYQASNDARSSLSKEADARVAADSDRRIATEALSQARAAQEQAAKDRATVLGQNGQLIEIALALENQIARLGVDPVVPPNDVLKLKALTAVPSANTPGAFVGPTTGAGGGRSTGSPAVAPVNPSRPAATRSTTPPPRPSSTPAPIPVPSPTPSASLPIIKIPVCLPPLVCIG